ncbi:hypothetical protein RND81_07G136900 [Saponaria officinalis]|uniref:PDZ domain-containing protein n=1 Tax=Saponaria officinalis TaxID=3572 RepID=A0AAW1JN53_SAPOF
MLRPHSTKIKSGDPVITVGRYFYDDYDYMAAPGLLSMERFGPLFYDCNELVTARCNITRCGDGAPVINLSGEVLGISFYDLFGSPILPINVANMWWKHYKQYKEMRHLSYGFEGCHLYSAILPFLERFLQSFPNINNGVRVDKVLPGSFAESAGLLENDVIVKCDGISVKSFLELWGLMWNKVGDAVELEVARIGVGTIHIIHMTVGEAGELNKWHRYAY